jgi:hypothetical protein
LHDGLHASLHWPRGTPASQITPPTHPPLHLSIPRPLHPCPPPPAPQAESLLLVGDQKQLPPTVKCRAAERLGLGCSLFVRLQAMGLEPLLLDTQYRM